MKSKKISQADRLRRYADLIQKQTGLAIRPYRADGYVNMMNRYGTSKDTSEHYKFIPEETVSDEVLTMFYEGNGLFAKIIDTPAEEAIKHGFTLDGLSDQNVEDFYVEALDELDWEETAMTAIKWTRLFGGAIAVLLVNDGRGLEEPLDWKNIQSIDDIRIYDRSVIQPDYTSMLSYEPNDPFRTRGSRLGMPEYYHIFSKYGSFTVHDSRCLVFKNGILPENATNSIYQIWGMPEYVRINKAIRDAELAHRSAPKLLDRSVQPVYKMKDLAAELSTEEGEERVLRRLQVIDMARGLLNSLVIDNDGEDYDFKTFQFSGVNDVVSSSCNMLSAITNIPQTILFGQGIGGLSTTDDTSMENYYNYIERIQKRMLKSNLRYLLSIIFQAGLATGEIDETPKIKVEFNPLWSISDAEKVDLELKKAQIQQVKAQTAQIYIQMEAIDPSEVRKKLANSEEFDVESMLDEYDDEDLFPDAEDEMLQENFFPQNSGGNASAAAPTATKLPQDMSAEEFQKSAKASENDDSAAQAQNYQEPEKRGSVGVLVVSDGMVLSGIRHNDFGYGMICGPGGHIENGETPEQAAFRETEEEFGIRLKELVPLGFGPYEPDTGLTPYLFLCTEYEGEPYCADLEMTNASFRTLEGLGELEGTMFRPFADSLEILSTCLNCSLFFDDDNFCVQENFIDSIKYANTYNEDDEWITMKGTHVLIGEGGEVIGGPPNLKGRSYPKAQSKKSTSATKKSKSTEMTSSNTAKHKCAEGSDISMSYKGSEDIKSVIRAQGFDGIPQVISSQEEFDEIVKASSFIAQRTYSASSQEVLDAYRDELYNGDWYVECTEGGAQYGQGMYCAADYSGKISDGIKAEMKHYQELYTDLGEPKSYNEWLTEADKALSDAGISDDTSRQWAEAYFEKNHEKSRPLMEVIPEDTRDKINSVLAEVPKKKDQPHYTETMTLDRNAKIVKYNDIAEMKRNETDDRLRAMDVGAYAALKGYDAINAEGHGESGSYTVILNRTKVVMLDARGKNDGLTNLDVDGKILFQIGKDGLVYAIRGGQVIGWVCVSEGLNATPVDKQD